MSKATSVTRRPSKWRAILMRAFASFVIGMAITGTSFVVAWIQLRDDFIISANHRITGWDLSHLNHLLLEDVIYYTVGAFGAAFFWQWHYRKRHSIERDNKSTRP